MGKKDAVITSVKQPADGPRVAVILVNWNGLADTLACLESLGAVTYPNFFVIVVDNGSRGDDAAVIKSAYPQAVVLETRKNLGFTGGSNVGIQHALRERADYLLCLNNDTTVAPDFLDALVREMERHEDIGIASSTIVYADRPDIVSEQGIWVDLSRMGPAGHIGENERFDPSFAAFGGSDSADVPSVSGCVLLMRRAVAEAVGGFQTNYFAYCEDVDLCLRARALGWKCVIVPRSVIWHKISSATGGENSPTAIHYSIRNNYRLVMQHGLPQERASFKHQYREYWLQPWETLVRDGTANTAVWKDETRLKSVCDMRVNACIGRLRCSGPRASYQMIEKGIRFYVSACLRFTRIQCNYLASPWTRLYWKVYSWSPGMVASWPKPLPNRSEEQKQRHAVGQRLRQQAHAARLRAGAEPAVFAEKCHSDSLLNDREISA